MKLYVTIVGVLLLFYTVFVFYQVGIGPASSVKEKMAVKQVATQLSSSEKQVVKMQFVKRSSIGLPSKVSQVGGVPYIDENHPYPVLSVPYCFLAQVNFSDVPEVEGLPQKGLLQFFVSCSESAKRNPYVRFVPLSSETQKKQVQVQVLGQKLESIVPDEYDIKFQLRSEYMSCTNKNFPSISVTPKIGSYDKVEVYTGISAVGKYSKLSGYPYFVDKDTRSTIDKQLLAQFIVDKQIFQFYTAENEIANGDFTRTELVIQTLR